MTTQPGRRSAMALALASARRAARTSGASPGRASSSVPGDACSKSSRRRRSRLARYAEVEARMTTGWPDNSEFLVDVFTHGRVERSLRVVEGAQARFELVAGANEGVHCLVEFPLAGFRRPVADPEALLEEGAQARVHGLLGFDFT